MVINIIVINIGRKWRLAPCTNWMSCAERWVCWPCNIPLCECCSDGNSRITKAPRGTSNPHAARICERVSFSSLQPAIPPPLKNRSFIQIHTMHRLQRLGFAGSTFFCFSRQQHARHTSFSRESCHGSLRERMTHGFCYGRRHYYGLQRHVFSAATLLCWENG